MKEVFEKNGLGVKLRRMECADPQKVDLEGLVGLAFPVAMQGTYPFVWDFIKSLPSSRGTPVFMVDTLYSFSGGAVGPVKKILADKGYRPLGAKEIYMPNNIFLFRINAAANARKVEKALKAAARYANRIMEGRARWPRLPLLSDMMSRISLSRWVWQWGRRLLPFKVDNGKCVRCGLCARMCPVRNIEMTEYPAFRDGCVLCMRCVSFCPSGAIYALGGGHNVYRAVKAEELEGK
jgi:ferredoxin